MGGRSAAWRLSDRLERLKPVGYMKRVEPRQSGEMMGVLKSVLLLWAAGMNATADLCF